MKIVKAKGQSWQDVAETLANAIYANHHGVNASSEYTVAELCNMLEPANQVASVEYHQLLGRLREAGIDVFWPAASVPVFLTAGGRRLDEVFRAAGFWWAHDAMTDSSKVVALGKLPA